MNHQAERRVGTVIGAKWRVDALLGSGSMAAVYAVTHRNGARAALKILHPTLCTDPAVCERFLGEGYLTNSVRHPGIVRVLDDGVTDDGCVFLVMDLLEGDTLEAYRQRCGGRIPLVESLDLAEKLMDVLSAVHHAGIIHRDLKPQNVFVCTDGTVKLLDFGVARVLDRSSQSKLSLFGLVLGTPSFMSPEQALGSRDKVDHRSDIWSLGATIFTALTGETVHLGPNVQARLLAAATVKARSISMVMPDLPLPIAAAIDMALRFKKEDRWQSVDAFRRAIRDTRAELGLGRLLTPGSPFVPEAASAAGDDGAPPPVAGAHPTDPVAPRSPRAPFASLPELATGPHGARLITPPSPMPPMRASRPDGQEGSIPATYGGPEDPFGETDLRDDGMRRKAGMGVWLVAVLLASTALAAITFFAVKGQREHASASADPAPPAASTETASPLPVPLAVPAPLGTIQIGDPDEPDASGAASTQPSAARPAIATTAPRLDRPPPAPASRPAPEDDKTPPAATTSEPTRPPPGLAPDPFGTPE